MIIVLQNVKSKNEVEFKISKAFLLYIKEILILTKYLLNYKSTTFLIKTHFFFGFVVKKNLKLII